MAISIVIDEDTRSDALWQAIQATKASSPTAAIDIVRVGDANCLPIGTADSVLLAWAVQEHRLIVSHDKSTLIDAHSEMVNSGVATPGLLIVKRQVRLPDLVEFICLVADAGERCEFESATQFIPF